ncbi:HAD family hydrolase [Oribacterium sp. NK2B42]|uniref:HAD family hydrolase n=1 Tax=Oribacterium sp. NK2B42 TaxID=689781 RepID=UPI0003FD5108|nr:HAD family hydrolase [Oribacterium sp. NK2B42]
MKKLISLMLALALPLSITACNSTSIPASTTAAAVEETTAAESVESSEEETTEATTTAEETTKAETTKTEETTKAEETTTAAAITVEETKAAEETTEAESASEENKIIDFTEKKAEKTTTLPEWDPSSKAMQSLVEFVSASVDENSKSYIPVKDRIAVFDMDGTLTCETFFTYYDTCMFISYCLEDHPEKVSDDLKQAALELKPGYTAGEALARKFAKAYAGMTVKELYDYAVEFGQKKTPSFNNMRYLDGFYLPMVEVVKYLYDNDYTIYVVSGTERTTTRAIVANSPISEYVSPSHVIGTEFEVKVKGNEEVPSNMDFKYKNGDELVLTGGFIQKNLNANKTIWIEREIGQYPVLAFGNSGSDTSMMNYALDERNPYPAQAYMVVADDDVREWGTQKWDEKSADYEKQGYIPISMRNDFVNIYPEGITRADVQYHEPEVNASVTETAATSAETTAETQKAA